MTQPLTPERIAELRALCRDATPGKLRVEEVRYDSGEIEWELWLRDRWVAKVYAFSSIEPRQEEREGGTRKALATLLVAARNAIPALLDAADENVRLRAEVESARAQALADRSFQTENTRLAAECDALRAEVKRLKQLHSDHCATGCDEP